VLVVTAPVICSDAEYSTRPPTDDDKSNWVTNTDPATRYSLATDPPGPQMNADAADPAA
jgi:hypothetical protein